MFLHSVEYKNGNAKPNEYPFDIPMIKAMNQIIFNDNVTFIVGENGSGKSTLMEAIAIKMGLNAEGGSRYVSFSTRLSHSRLYKELKIHKHHIHPQNHFFLRAESFYNLATEIDKLDKAGKPLLPQYGGISLHEQSHGESFFSLFMHKFGENGFYVLDEPEAALSTSRQMAMLVRMSELINQNCQFIIATHSPILLSYPNSTIYEIKNDKIKKVSYEETEMYSLTKYFLNNYKKMHRDLGLIPNI